MEPLPDDVILVVLEHLPLEDLFTSRLVCKRFADLALAPDVWRRRQILDYHHHSYHQKKCQVCPALRLAPRVNRMCLDLSKKPRHPPFATTKCAAVELSVYLDGSACSARAAVPVIGNQVELGRLQRLYLAFYRDVTPGAEPDVSLLLQTVASTCGLKKLSLYHMFSLQNLTRLATMASTFSCNTKLESSLTHFHCGVQLGPCFENFVLAAHAATLESVDISTPSPSTAELLAAAPKLRTLCSPLLTGMEALAACQSLSVVRLQGGFCVTAGDTSKLPGAAQFFRGANQLREVCLKHVDPCDGVDLVRALAASGRSRVEELSLVCSGRKLGEVQPLLDALASLPALRCLEMKSLVDGQQVKELLLGIRAETAPALRSLILTPTGHLQCAHSWVHSRVTKAVLTANPLLHIQMKARTHGRSAYEAKDCRTCRVKKCHDEHEGDWEVLRMSTIFVGLSSCNDARHCFEKFSRNSDDVFWWRVDL